ncbi:hypothetical protein C8Q70DRAFT_1049574 [Cubamyces menziesii]|uniref:Uncharacterized protein n=1 Tax=Trametes cubensis TaxID=1111947 RepID=A0AAD7XDS4_9APHY|nr:hypothetical protein C8Q70DRAFT_1049574 [Cubamyces menziesii]KAJ8489087.1 hypothetical protein ONZ51_g3167 [Trametes cubensis]
MEHSYAKAGGNVFYSPSPGSYAVIRLNPVEMVRPLNDARALLGAQAMRPKSYLERSLPWPNHSWYRFEVGPIGASLRPEDEARGITSDLCILISPNTSRPNGREPVKPEAADLFPYNNCYHWFEPKMVDVRVQTRPEKFDETTAVALSVRTRMQMERVWDKDYLRVLELQKRLRAVVSVTKTGPLREDSPPSDSVDVSAERASHQRPADFKDVEAFSVNSGAGPTLDRQSVYSLDDLAAMDIFNGPNDDVELSLSSTWGYQSSATISNKKTSRAHSSCSLSSTR